MVFLVFSHFPLGFQVGKVTTPIPARAREARVRRCVKLRATQDPKKERLDHVRPYSVGMLYINSINIKSFNVNFHEDD